MWSLEYMTPHTRKTTNQVTPWETNSKSASPVGPNVSSPCSQKSVSNSTHSKHVKILRWVINSSPYTQTVKSPLVGCPRLLIQCIRVLPRYLVGQPIGPQSEDAPYSVDRDGLIRDRLYEITLMISNGRDGKQSSLLTRAHCGLIIWLLLMWREVWSAECSPF